MRRLSSSAAIRDRARRDSRAALTAVGPLAGTRPGGCVSRASGRRTRFGAQFHVAAATPIVPATADGIERYLGSGLIAGIGPGFARRIVRSSATRRSRSRRRPSGCGSRQARQETPRRGRARSASVAGMRRAGVPRPRPRPRHGPRVMTLRWRDHRRRAAKPCTASPKRSTASASTADRIGAASASRPTRPAARAARARAARGADGDHRSWRRQPARAAALAAVDVDGFHGRVDRGRSQAVVEDDAVPAPPTRRRSPSPLACALLAAAPADATLREADDQSGEQRRATLTALAGGVVVDHQRPRHRQDDAG